ncbi:hypothetical protein ACET3Z_009558 [Daucus carota]
MEISLLEIVTWCRVGHTLCRLNLGARAQGYEEIRGLVLETFGRRVEEEDFICRARRSSIAFKSIFESKTQT